MRKILTKRLRPGMKNARPIYDNQGILLLNSGAILTDGYIRQLGKLKINSLYIEDGLIPDVIVEDMVLEETRQRAHNTLRQAVKTFKESPINKNQNSLVMVKSELTSVLDSIIAELLDNRDLTVDLSEIRTADDYTFSHSINVSLLSVITGISLNLPPSALRDLGLGALLHDLGKTLTPLEILNKTGGLQESELKTIRQHPLDGHNLAQGGKRIYSDKSLAVIYQHHERIDGSGYPLGLQGDEIEPLSKVCALADVYDALVADRPYRAAYPSYEALEIMQSESQKFDLPTMQAFFQHIPAYPIGTVVSVNNDYIGVVVRNTIGYPTHPQVRIVATKDLEKIQPFEVDLVVSLDMVIDDVYKEEQLPELYRSLGVAY